MLTKRRVKLISGYGMIVLMLLVSIPVLAASPAEKPGLALKEAKIENPEAVADRESFFVAGSFFFSGQPDEEAFKWLATQGVTLVINLRTNEEMEKLKEIFDEPKLVKELSMNYVQIPLGGESNYYPEATDQLAEALAHHQGKALIHCFSARRVSYLWIAYLVKYRGYSLNDAIAIGKKIKFYLPLEDLLGKPISIEVKQ
jgi:protein tyrosine phosphatase (PTP) superfamily phosphohydrolase (DUF442 family)